MNKMTAYSFVIVTIGFTALGQILIKWQAMQAGSLPAAWGGRVSFFLGLLFNPWIIAGLLCAVVAACAWILAMTRLPISVAYPLVALTYPLVLAASWVIFGETLSPWRMVGVGLILAGVALLGIE
jgi:multidrug transporter EmrE-like cation transporter